MKGSLPTTTAILALSLMAPPLFAADGVLIVQRTTRQGSTQTHQVQIEKTRMRAETAGPNGAPQVIVFDGTAQIVRIINPEKKTYSEITKAEMDQAAAQMKGMMAQMQEQMKNLPPAQRAQMEAVMAGRGAGTPVKTEYKKTGTDKVGQWTCDKYEGYRDGKKSTELCTVDPKVLGLAAADLDVTKQLATFFQQLLPQNADQLFSVGQADPQGFSGMPVRRSYTILNETVVTEVSAVSRQNFSDAIFSVPAGFEKEASPFGGRGGARGGRGRQ